MRFQYDAEGRLLKKIGAPTYGGDSGVRQYVYDQTSRLLEYDGSGSAVARFSYGSDRLISMWHLTEGTRFYHLDGLRSVTALTDTTGAVTANLRLDTWGNFRFPADLSSTANRFAFTGHIFDTETQLYQAGARFYDPANGRFITQDSFLGEVSNPPSLHRYMYAFGNPTRFVDPTGHAPEEGKQTPAWVHWAVGVMDGADEFQKQLGKVPEQLAQQLVTPGNPQNKGVVAQKQRELLAVARDPNRPVVARVEAASEALKMQPAAIVEETVVRPVMEAPGHAKAAGQHLAQAETAKSPVEKAVHYLEATKETAQAFTGFATPAALVTGGGTRTAATTSEAELAPRVVRAGEAVTDDFAPQAAGAAEQATVRQTMATGKEWYDYLAGRYGASNVEWTSGSGRTIQWPSQLPTPSATEMLRVRPPARSGSFVPDLATVAGPRPAGAVAHHVKPLFMGGTDSGTTNAAWAAEAAHQAGHATLNREVVPLPYGTWIVVKP